MRSKSIPAAFCAGLLVDLSAQPAGAVSGGVPHVDHPNVGALLPVELRPAVAITSGGDQWCRGFSRNQRLDLPAVRSFLHNFV
jgi:hypothetical protein